MSRQGIGIGSASLVLIFTVLCLAIFALISYTSACNDLALVRSEAEMTAGYYTADTEAETIVEALLASEPQGTVTEFTCEISDERELYVRIEIVGSNQYNILSWQMRDIHEWVPDTNLPVWPGE